jgi:hypothetical protein
MREREIEREGVRDTPSWVAGPRVGAGGGVVAMAIVGVDGGLDEIPATFGSPTALTRDGGGVGRRRGTGGKQSRRWLRLTTRSARVWGVGGVYGTINLVISAAGPHLLLYGAGRRGPTSHLGWAPPIRVRL